MKSKKQERDAGGPDQVRSVAPGILRLGTNDIECHVLSDGRRVLETKRVDVMLGAAARKGDLVRSVKRIGAELQGISVPPSPSPVPFIRPTGGVANGYEAEAILDICLIFQEALIHQKLHPRQIPIAVKACEIVGACAKVGIVALIDEATGYELIRKHGELAAVFRRFFVDKATQWEAVFTAELSAALCKLYRMPFKRNPRWMASVNAKIYGIVLGRILLRELQRRNPDPHYGNNHHQWLQEAVRRGFRHKLEVVLLLANTSSYIEQFWDRMIHTFQGEPMQLELATGGNAA